MAFVVADDKVEDFLKEKADKDKVKQIYKVAERFEKHHKPKPQTNADRIRAMSDEELVEFLVDHHRYPCKYCLSCWTVRESDEGGCKEELMSWLKSEAKE